MGSSGRSPFKGQSILVTGASGFIGAHLVEELVRQGAHVHALVRPGYPLSAPKSVARHNAELTDLKTLRAVIRKVKPRRVAHLGGRVNLERSFDIAKDCLRSNAEGTLNLLEALKDSPPESLVFLSTEEVYGDGPVPFKETQKERPPSPYAVSKLAAEQLCGLYHRLYGMNSVVLRCSTCYGPGQAKWRLIPSLVRDCLAGRTVRLKSPNQRRDFLYVDDAVEGILKALALKKAIGETINLGSSKTVSIGEIAKKIRAATDSRSKIAHDRKSARARESLRWSASGVKARTILGWAPRTALSEGLQQTISWTQQQK